MGYWSARIEAEKTEFCWAAWRVVLKVGELVVRTVGGRDGMQAAWKEFAQVAQWVVWMVVSMAEMMAIEKAGSTAMLKVGKQVACWEWLLAASRAEMMVALKAELQADLRVVETVDLMGAWLDYQLEWKQEVKPLKLQCVWDGWPCFHEAVYDAPNFLGLQAAAPAAEDVAGYHQLRKNLSTLFYMSTISNAYAHAKLRQNIS